MTQRRAMIIFALVMAGLPFIPGMPPFWIVLLDNIGLAGSKLLYPNGRLQAFELLPQCFAVFHMPGIHRNARDRANLHALGFVEMAHALGALGRVDFVDFLAQVDGLVRAFRFADITVDAFVGDHQSHCTLRRIGPRTVRASNAPADPKPPLSRARRSHQRQ